MVLLLDGEDERVVQLAPLLHLDLESGIAGPDRRLEALQLLIAGAFAAVYGDELVGIRPELAQRLVHDLGVVAEFAVWATVNITRFQ